MVFSALLLVIGLAVLIGVAVISNLRGERTIEMDAGGSYTAKKRSVPRCMEPEKQPIQP
jgi:hypothetical protein